MHGAFFSAPAASKGQSPVGLKNLRRPGRASLYIVLTAVGFATTDATVNPCRDSPCAEPLLSSLTLDLHEAGIRREAFDTASKGSAPFAPTRSTTTR